MNCFILDSYGKTASVAIFQNDNLLFEHVVDNGFTHSETLLPLCADAFEKSGISVSEMNVFGVTVGPGSFTGLRIGLATIKGLALPYNIPIAPVSTLEALAYTATEGGMVIPALDARRNEIYCAAFKKQGTTLTRIIDDRACPVESLDDLLEACKTSVKFVGDGAALCYNIYSYLPNALEVDAAPVNIAVGAFPVVSELYKQSNLISSSAVSPVYLRLSQAERELLAKNNT